MASECRPLTQTTSIGPPPQQHQAEPVLDVEALELDALAVDGAEEDAVVGEHAVHVESQQPDRPRRPASIMGRLPSAVPQVERALQQRGEPVERPLRRGIAERARRVGMGLEEESVGSRHRRRRHERGDVLAQAAARAAARLPRLLHGVGRVEDHRRAGGGAQPGEVPHVDDQVAVAEEGAPLGHRHVGGARPRAPSRPRRAIASACIHCPFFTFTGLPVRPAASSRSVCRQRKAGIWSASTTSGAGAACAGSWMSVSTGSPLARLHPLERLEPRLQPRAARARRAGRDWPCRTTP